MPSSEAEIISIHREIYRQREYDPRDTRLIKQTIIDAIDRYVAHGIEPGGFVSAVLANDLADAVLRADGDNLLTIPAIVTYVHNEVSSNLCGSRDIVNTWIDYQTAKRAAVDKDIDEMFAEETAKKAYDLAVKANRR